MLPIVCLCHTLINLSTQYLLAHLIAACPLHGQKKKVIAIRKSVKITFTAKGVSRVPSKGQTGMLSFCELNKNLGEFPNQKLQATF